MGFLRRVGVGWIGVDLKTNGVGLIILFAEGVQVGSFLVVEMATPISGLRSCFFWMYSRSTPLNIFKG